ncbi:MAG: cysteine hydrolase [Gammaproteobacteria bacterium]|nr:cysteine hydrolase [Sideroxydans sp.]MBU3903499.1 cysteine hydrolase [Gammaproteobacteria bacterium]MBU4044792.1 cysteine hydrolase [Gammaproteobacteria bacterium]MBU4150967.1 cysteine hydrolase [Gammaproteobacteria bacterium]
MNSRHDALIVIDMQRDFLDPGGYAATAGMDVSALRQPIPFVRTLLDHARRHGMLVVHTREGHRPDLSDCPPAKLARSREAGAEIGSQGPLGRLLVRGEYGHDFIDELQPLSGEPVVDKPGYGAFHQTDLAQILAARDISRLYICGVTTEVCVHSTLREASDRGFECVLVADACGSAHPHLHAAALQMVAVEGGIFGRVAEAQTVISELEAAQ